MITVIGDLVVDIIVKHNGMHFATDSESSITTHAGGQANNVASWIALTGGRSTLIGRVGDDVNADFLIRHAEDIGVTLKLHRDETHETGKIVILVDDEESERTMFTDRGANRHLNMQQIHHAQDTIKDSSCLYLSGYSLFEDTTREALETAKQIAKQHGVPIAVDPSSTYFLRNHKQTMLSFIDGIDYFFPNLEEGQLLTGETEPKAVLAALSDIVRHPVLKLGSEGCMVMLENNIHVIPAPTIEAIDTTGAGDAFIAAFLKNYMEEKDLIEAAKFANLTASKVVQRIGAKGS
ncbi:carbohydrate kinase family protein [Thalassobacillus hwangdonensis]|uniref:Carbohydrate kinase family protein n=1 Tax=Thalassobacillus hwangdonensis TaxID=546108 RepID=A0ABW3L5F2_9BACI